MPIYKSIHKALEGIKEVFSDKSSALRLYQDSESSLDKFGTVAILRTHMGLKAYDKTELERVLLEHFSSGVFWVLHEGGKSSIFHTFGEVPDEIRVTEGALKFLARPNRHPHAGVFLDTKSVREYLICNSSKLRVLNLFSFTCSLSVAAHIGGASFVRNVDSHGGVLKWGNENLKANNIPHENASMIKEDVRKFLNKSKNNTYDLIIFDPPSFGVSNRGAFSLHEDILYLFSHLKRILTENGRILLLNHDSKIIMRDLVALLRDLGFSLLESRKPAWDRNGPSSSSEWVVLKEE